MSSWNVKGRAKGKTHNREGGRTQKKHGNKRSLGVCNSGLLFLLTTRFVRYVKRSALCTMALTCYETPRLNCQVSV